LSIHYIIRCSIAAAKSIAPHSDLWLESPFMSPEPETLIPLSSSLLPGIPLVESPLFAASLKAMGLSEAEHTIAVQLNTRGFAVLDFPDPEIDARIDRIKANLAPHYAVDVADPAVLARGGDLRVQDAWTFDEDVRAIAANPALLELLAKLYGRRAFPFQTLNFPVGTQQPAHADAIHFSSQPERFMCGVWLAMEDVTAESGPLVYYPGSHAWPIVSNAMIGRRGWESDRISAQAPFQLAWDAMIDASEIAPEMFLARKGQALIWAANLLHGGSPRTDPTRTRWSQVTHYYFADCAYYTPAFSDEPLGRLDLRTITNAATGEIEPNRMMGEELVPYRPATRRRSQLTRLFRRAPPRDTQLPSDFNAAAYLVLNPDVAASGHDAATHYLAHGLGEGRRYRP
jgi:hypothetical protein